MTKDDLQRIINDLSQPGSVEITVNGRGGKFEGKAADVVKEWLVKSLIKTMEDLP